MSEDRRLEGREVVINRGQGSTRPFLLGYLASTPGNEDILALACRKGCV